MMNKLILKIPNIGDYYVARETHKESKENPYHLHIWFELTQKPNFKNPKCFDIDGFHPNIGNKKRNWIWNYLKKQDTEPYTNIPDGFVALARQGLVQEATEQFINLYPKDYVINKDRIDKNLKNLSRKESEVEVFPLKSDYEPTGWDSSQKTLLLTGATEAGKTEWIKSYITHKLKKTFFMCNTSDQLKRYGGQDYIIYDDFNFPENCTRNDVINLFEIRNPRTVRCRHSDFTFPAGIRKVISTNPEIQIPFRNNPAVNRRLHEIILAPSLRFY
jgi:hypothetical protein